MKIKIEGALLFGKYDWDRSQPRFQFFDYVPQNDPDGFVMAAMHTIEVEIADDFDPRGAMVASLEREKEKLSAAFQVRINEINAQIQSLLAIEA
jgi:hypothetical protein